MNYIARAQNFSDAPPLACAEPTKGNEIDLSFLRLCLTRCLHAWASHILEGLLLLGQRYYTRLYRPENQFNAN